VPTDIVPEEEVKKRYGEEAARQYQQAMQYAREAKARREIVSAGGAEYTREAYQRVGEPKTREEHEAAIQKVEKEIREVEKKSQAEAIRAQAREELERSYKWIEELPIIREARAWQPTWGGPGFRDIQKAVATFPERALKTGAFFGIGLKYLATKPEVWELEKLKEVPSATVEIGKEMLAHPAELAVDIAITGAIAKGVGSAISRARVGSLTRVAPPEVKLPSVKAEPTGRVVIAREYAITKEGDLRIAEFPAKEVIKSYPEPPKGEIPPSILAVGRQRLQLLQKPVEPVKIIDLTKVKPQVVYTPSKTIVAMPLLAPRVAQKAAPISMVKPEIKTAPFVVPKVEVKAASKVAPALAPGLSAKQTQRQPLVSPVISIFMPKETTKATLYYPKLKGKGLPNPHLDTLPWKERRKEVGKAPHQAKAYQPSVMAIGLKIKAPKAPKVVVGPEIRPMVRLRK
jgi:hypothetical protein